MLKDKSTLIGIVGIILTAIGIFFPILYNEFSNKSELEIRQESTTTIINKPTEVRELEIFYKKEAITNLNKKILKISNKSNLAIIKSDFISPLSISFTKGVRIISFEVEDRVPQNLLSEITIDSTRQSLNIAFDLLNPDDNVKIGILYTGDAPAVEVQARIKGIRRVNFYKSEDKKTNIIPIIIFIAIVISFLVQVFFIREKKACIESLEQLEQDKKNEIKYSSDELISRLPLIFSAYPPSSVNKIKKNISEIFIEGKTENEVNKALNLINQELIQSVSINKKGELFLRVLRFIGLCYLIVWFLNSNNESLSFLFRK